MSYQNFSLKYRSDTRYPWIHSFTHKTLTASISIYKVMRGIIPQLQCLRNSCSMSQSTSILEGSHSWYSRRILRPQSWYSFFPECRRCIETNQSLHYGKKTSASKTKISLSLRPGEYGMIILLKFLFGANFVNFHILYDNFP